MAPAGRLRGFGVLESGCSDGNGLWCLGVGLVDWHGVAERQSGLFLARELGHDRAVGGRQSVAIGSENNFAGGVFESPGGAPLTGLPARSA